jgi:hypothetical protein
MDTKELGSQLARLIEATVNPQSMDDIGSTLGQRCRNIFLEYIALLLWIATKESSIVLPKEYAQTTSNAIFSAIFLLLEEAGIKKRVCDFNAQAFESFIHDRFETYYRAWRAFPIDDIELSEANVAHNFIVLCLTDEEDLTKAGEEYRKLFPKPADYITHLKCVLHHYRQFVERVKSVLSRF